MNLGQDPLFLIPQMTSTQSSWMVFQQELQTTTSLVRSETDTFGSVEAMQDDDYNYGLY